MLIEATSGPSSSLLRRASIYSGSLWNAANRLAEENLDFMECVKLVRQFYQTGNIREADWDIPQN